MPLSLQTQISLLPMFYCKHFSPLFPYLCFMLHGGTGNCGSFEYMVWMRMAGAQRSDWNAGVIIMVSNLFSLIGSIMKHDFF